MRSVIDEIQNFILSIGSMIIVKQSICKHESTLVLVMMQNYISFNIYNPGKMNEQSGRWWKEQKKNIQSLQSIKKHLHFDYKIHRQLCPVWTFVCVCVSEWIYPYLLKTWKTSQINLWHTHVHVCTCHVKFLDRQTFDFQFFLFLFYSLKK